MAPENSQSYSKTDAPSMAAGDNARPSLESNQPRPNPAMSPTAAKEDEPVMSLRGGGFCCGLCAGCTCCACCECCC